MSPFLPLDTPAGRPPAAVVARFHDSGELRDPFRALTWRGPGDWFTYEFCRALANPPVRRTGRRGILPVVCRSVWPAADRLHVMQRGYSLEASAVQPRGRSIAGALRGDGGAVGAELLGCRYLQVQRRPHDIGRMEPGSAQPEQHGSEQPRRPPEIGAVPADEPLRLLLAPARSGMGNGGNAEPVQSGRIRVVPQCRRD